MAIQLTNTLTGAKEPFLPAAPPRVSMYVCGPTVYDTPHIGNLRPAIVFDVLRRHLVWRGYDVLHVQNITDVDDKIINKANELGVSAAIVAERYTRVYLDAMRALGVQPPDLTPRASGHIGEMIEMIAALIERGYAYEGEGSVWFAVEKFDEYGKLSRQRIEDLRAGERVQPEPGTLSPLDFALWKAAKPGEPFWNSPWGPGRPGWHIECSAMTTKYLGMGFDIHGGGSDLIFPHHENEIAQSEAAHGSSPFARVWLHNGHVQIDGEKMSKSLRNFILVDEMLAEYAPQVIRLFVLSAHYRSPMTYSPDLLDEARSAWERFAAFLRAVPAAEADPGDLLHEFGAAMDDDLATPRAIAALHALVSQGHAADPATAARCRAAVAAGLEILGIELPSTDAAASIGPVVDYLLELRARARAAKDYALGDEIRDRLSAAGILVEDTANGSRWHISG